MTNHSYVDDIVGVGNPVVIENIVKIIKLLEERKKFTFSNINSVIVKILNKDRGYRGPIAQICKGPINMACTSKYVGEILTNSYEWQYE